MLANFHKINVVLSNILLKIDEMPCKPISMRMRENKQAHGHEREAFPTRRPLLGHATISGSCKGLETLFGRGGVSFEGIGVWQGLLGSDSAFSLSL
jgi:hypothetical protein